MFSWTGWKIVKSIGGFAAVLSMIFFAGRMDANIFSMSKSIEGVNKKLGEVAEDVAGMTAQGMARDAILTRHESQIHEIITNRTDDRFRRSDWDAESKKLMSEIKEWVLALFYGKAEK